MITCILENKHQTSFRHVVVHAIVEKDNQLLLERRSLSLSLEGGKWALPGGFLDRDETASQGVLRELQEETGWEGKVLKLFRVNSNPNRPHEDRQNVVLEFLVDPIKVTNKPDQEVIEIKWFDFKNLPKPEEMAFDHRETLEYYLKYKEKAFPLPLVI